MPARTHGFRIETPVSHTYSSGGLDTSARIRCSPLAPHSGRG